MRTKTRTTGVRKYRGASDAASGSAADSIDGEIRRTLGVVVAHGALAHGLVSAVERIVGEASGTLRPLSNEGLSPEELRARIEEVANGHPAVVFTDMESGSCGLAAKNCCRGRAGRVSVGGVNLPMLLDFVYAERDRPGELGRRMVERGRGAISLGRGG